MNYAGQQRHQCLSANGASITYRHDGAGRLIEIAHASPNSPLLSIQYLYDAAGNVRVRNDVLPSGPRTEHFAYDSLYRLAHELSDTDESFDISNFGPSVSQLANPLPNGQSAINTLIGSTALPQVSPTYDYDLVGNREIERLEAGNEIDYSNNSLDQYTSCDGTNFIHDTNGNLKNDQQRTYIYDSRNRLVSVEEAVGQVVTQYWHDAVGRRILERAVGAGTFTQLIHDGDDIVSEYRNGSLLAQSVYDDGIDRPLHIAAQEKEHWYHVDLVGSVRILTDITGKDIAKYRYLPFGELIELTDDDVFNPWRYTGRRFDVDLETYDFRTRQYDPNLGRFLQRDPGGMVDSTNLYQYVLDAPLSFYDPLGMQRKEHDEHGLLENAWHWFELGAPPTYEILEEMAHKNKHIIEEVINYNKGLINFAERTNTIAETGKAVPMLPWAQKWLGSKWVGRGFLALHLIIGGIQIYKGDYGKGAWTLAHLHPWVAVGHFGFEVGNTGGRLADKNFGKVNPLRMGKLFGWDLSSGLSSSEDDYSPTDYLAWGIEELQLAIIPNLWKADIREKYVPIRPLEEGFLSRQLVCYGPGQECRYDLYERDPQTRQVQEAGSEYGGFLTDKGVYISPVRSGWKE